MGIFRRRQGKPRDMDDAFALNNAYCGENVVLGISQRTAKSTRSWVSWMAALVVLRGWVFWNGALSVFRQGGVVWELLWRFM